MKVGAERKKLGVLVGLMVVAAYLFYSNMSSEPDRPSAPAPIAARPAPPVERRETPSPPRMRSGRTGVEEFRPSLKPRRPEDRPDPMTIDPTLRLDLLARLQKVTVDGGERSLFEFSAAPLPKTPEPKIELKPVAQGNGTAKEPEKAEKKEPTKPPPPPISLKFYGYISPAATSIKRAFFLDGEEIFVAGEGDLIKKRYKVVRIGVNSAVLEDTQHDHKQTLTLEEQVG